MSRLRITDSELLPFRLVERTETAHEKPTPVKRLSNKAVGW